MLNYKRYLLSRLSHVICFGGGLIGLAACSSTPEVLVDPRDNMVGLTLEDEIYSFHTHQVVSDYTDRIAHHLFRNLRGKDLKQPMVVASFVNFDDTLKEASKLGNLISESLIGNMQAYNIPVMDIHLTGGVKLTATGDLVFSRDSYDMLDNGEVGYVLSGVVVESENGYIINARIMDLASKKIISTASSFIPIFVVENI